MLVDDNFLKDMTRFHGVATRATYASANNADVTPQRSGFRELEHRDGDWYYRDSYTGFLRSWGQEVIYFKDKPVWTNLYGGGMEPSKMSEDIAVGTFRFLKIALSEGEKDNTFQPRGPREIIRGEWRYASEMNGNIMGFVGSEFICFRSETVFYHNFHGGLIVSRGKS